MDTMLADLQANETERVFVVGTNEEENAAQKENAPEFAALEALVACATLQSTTEYTPELTGCQGISIPTLDEIEATIATAARKRIETAYAEVQDTRARVERERAARDLALHAIRQRVSETKTALEGLADERAAMEQRALAIMGGDELKAVMEKIHLAFNARQLELETAHASAEAEADESQIEAQAANLTDALEVQFAEQELERLATVAPDIAQTVQLAASAAENVAAALQAVKEGLLRDAEALLEQAKTGNADPERIAEVERVLADAKQARLARDLIARLSANPDQPGATKRIRKLMEEAQQAGVFDKVEPFASRALHTAREGANARFAQARPIAGHLASEGFVPVVGDGRIEVWQPVSRNGTATNSGDRSGTRHGTVWTLNRILHLRGEAEWVTETPQNPITRKELPERVRHSRWFRLSASPSS